eukprot:jgi/Picre1/33822/NNA_001301.t1
MAKRKAKTKSPAKKVRPKLDTAFTCPFCNAEKSVHCDLDKKVKVGKVVCAVCGEEWACEIHALSEPIDVYSDG